MSPFVPFIPPSKSESLRALYFHSLFPGCFKLSGLLESPDVHFLETLLERFEFVEKIDVGNSGINFRFLTALAALSSKTRWITGDVSIRERRPIKTLLDALISLGAEVCYLEKEGRAPYKIKGPIHAGEVEIDARDSQCVSALIIAATQLKFPSTFYLKEPKEWSYVEMTLRWLDRLSIAYEITNRDRIKVIPTTNFFPPKEIFYQVPLDFSSAAFPYAVTRIFEIPFVDPGLDFSQPQCDKALFTLVDRQEVDIEEAPDLLPILMVLALYGKGPELLKNVGITRWKESDRPGVMQKELEKMGAAILCHKDSLSLQPCELVGSKELFAHEDHRVAMSLTVAALGARGESIIQGVGCVQKSYPRFFETICPDWIAQIRKIDSGTVSIKPYRSAFCRS